MDVDSIPKNWHVRAVVPDPPKQSRHVDGQNPKQLSDSATISGENASLNRYQRWNGKLWLGMFDDIGTPSTKFFSHDEKFLRSAALSSGQFSSMNVLMAPAFISLTPPVCWATAHLKGIAVCRLFEYYAILYSFKQAPVSFKKPPSPTLEEMAAVIRAAWQRKDISQKQVERDLGIHQSQFSKIVNGKFKETNGHAGRLFEYSRQHEGAALRQSGAEDTEALRLALTERLMRAWDGTNEGARALKAILDGAERLRARQSRRV